MIITCPNCGRRFDLQRQPPTTFRCPKCSFTVPFSVVLHNQKSESKPVSTSTDDMPVAGNKTLVDSNETQVINEKPTRVVDNLQNDKTRMVEGLNQDVKTRLVPGLQTQPQKRAVFQMSYQGRSYGVINLPYGNFYNLGRQSSDSKAQIKLTPDISMSRIHAGMRTIQSAQGQVIYQITSAKSSNPVYVNGNPVPQGKSVNLKNGDTLRMGETTLVFRIL